MDIWTGLVEGGVVDEVVVATVTAALNYSCVGRPTKLVDKYGSPFRLQYLGT